MSQRMAVAAVIESDSDYAALESLVAQRVRDAAGPLFTTDAEGLFRLYLEGIQPQYRQHYTCSCCLRFVERYGGLVTIDESGTAESIMWGEDGIPSFFRESAALIRDMLDRSRVTGVFVNGDAVWGVPQTGEWSHLSGVPASVFKSPLKTAFQAEAEKKQDYIMLRRALGEIPMEAVVQAVRVLEADAVDRSEKTLGVAKWFLALHRDIASKREPAKSNLVWRAVATAPPGWCHVRSTMISTLLDDIIAGLPFDTIKARWDAKMHPLQYQRPTTVSEGNIRQANETVQKLGSEGALARRFARLADIVSLWRPTELAPVELAKGGAFDHLLPSRAKIKPVELPPIGIALDKFIADVLPGASVVEAMVPSGFAAFYGMTTAVNADALPILQWDGLAGCSRNPVAWYLYHGGSPASNWSLVAGQWVKVNAVCLKPCFWQKPDMFAHHGNGDVFFVLNGAKDIIHKQGGGFFPETLRSEYHGIRAAMEAYARSAEIVGKEEGDANGIMVGRGRRLRVRVTGKDGVREYVVG